MTRAWPTGTTRAAAVIGDPIRHSLSPVLYNAAFRELKLDWTFLAFEVASGEGAAAVDAIRVLGLDGLSVTMPHKEGVIPGLDRLTPAAAALGAVNVVVREGSELVGDSTDGPGFIDALRQDEGFDPTGRVAAVIGAGGAARAVVRALAEAGAAEVMVINRSAPRAEAAATMAGGVGRVAGFDDLRDADIVVNGTPVGMEHSPGLPLDPELLRDGQLVIDLIYHPAVTPLVAEARQRGLDRGTASACSSTRRRGHSDCGPGRTRRSRRCRWRPSPRSAPATVNVGVAAMCAVVGVAVGPWLALLADRVPERKPLSRPWLQSPDRALITVATAALFGAVGERIGTNWALPGFLVFTACLIVVTVTDLRLFLIPNRIIYPTLVATIVLLGATAVLYSDYGSLKRVRHRRVRRVVRDAGVPPHQPRGMAFGDVRLAAVIGAYEAWIGYGHVVLALFLAFIAAAAVGGFLIISRRRGAKDAVPFGPFLAFGAMTAVLFGTTLLDWYAG